MSEALRELYQHRELVWIWAMRSIKSRYQQTVLGGAWAILQPLALTAVYALVFSVFIKVDTGGVPYVLFAYAGLLPWTLFASSITVGVPSLVQNMDLITKIYFPREVLPMAAFGTPIVDFLAGTSVLVVFMLVFGSPVSAALLVLPLLLAIELTLALGLVLLGSAANVLLRDVGHLVPPALLIWQFATPIVYPLDLVPERLRSIYLLNPMAALVDGYKRALLYGEAPRWEFVGIALAVSVTVLVLGYAAFKHAEDVFADVI